MKIYFIKHETTFGPFFSTREKAIEHLSQNVEWWEEFGPTIMADKDPYCGIEEVELDDTSETFDG